MVLLHPGPGLRPRPLQGADRPVARGGDAGRLSRHARRAAAATPARPRSSGSSAGPTTCGSCATRCGSSGRSCSASGSARSSRSQYARAPPVASRRARPRRAGRADRAGALDRGLRAARRCGSARGRASASTARWTSRRSRTSCACASRCSRPRADERRDRPRRLEPRGADALDGRRGQGASTCAASSAPIEAPALVLAGEDDAWAPLESVREVADLPRRADALPELPGRAPLGLPRRAGGVRGAPAVPRRPPGGSGRA